jgi:CheY-like chemotaxis protein
VHGFTKQSGGDIQIESEPGKGTTVALHLPRTTAATQAVPGSAAPPEAVLNALRSSEGKVVLVVEDNAAAGDFAADLLRGLGYTARRADSAAGALAMLADEERIDAVFSDVMMPGGIDGAELAAILRASYPHIAVVLTSGYGMRPAQGRAPESVETLAKPYQLGELAAALERAFVAVMTTRPGQGIEAAIG